MRRPTLGPPLQARWIGRFHHRAGSLHSRPNEIRPIYEVSALTFGLITGPVAHRSLWGSITIGSLAAWCSLGGSRAFTSAVSQQTACRLLTSGLVSSSPKAFSVEGTCLLTARVLACVAVIVWLRFVAAGGETSLAHRLPK